MRLRSLDVRNFCIVRQASLTFGRGLNILYGPNDIGKSSLAEALRAAFLLPFGSTKARDLIPWGTDEVPRVVVEFAVQGEVWRVTKTFGSGAGGTAILERSTTGGTWREEAKAKTVDVKLREMLAWGVRETGAPRGSYLTTALLGRQDDVAGILATSIDNDDVDSGLQRVTAALGALGQDPRVTSLLDRLEERVAEVFTSNGNARPAGPLGKMTERVRECEQRLQANEGDLQKGAAIEHKFTLLIEKRAATAVHCARIEQRLTLLRALQQAEAEAEQIRSSQQLVESARGDVQSAGEDVRAKEQQYRAAKSERQSLAEGLRAARERLAKAGGASDQLQKHAQQAYEARRTELAGARDAAGRELQSAKEVDLARGQIREHEQELVKARANYATAQQNAIRAQRLADLAVVCAEHQRAIALNAAYKTAEAERDKQATLVAKAHEDHQKTAVSLADAERMFAHLKDTWTRTQSRATERLGRAEALQAKLSRIENAAQDALQRVGRAKHAAACGDRFVEAEKALAKLAVEVQDVAAKVTENTDQRKVREARLRSLRLVVVAAFVCGAVAAGVGLGFQLHLGIVVAVVAVFALAAVWPAITLVRCQGIMAEIATAREGLLETRNQIAAARGVAEIRLESAQSERAQAIAIVSDPDAAFREANTQLQLARAEREKVAKELAGLDGQLSGPPGVTPEQVKAAEQKVVALKKDVEVKRDSYDKAQHEKAKTQARLEEKSESLVEIDLTDIERRVAAARSAVGDQPKLTVSGLAGAMQAATELETTMKIVQDRLKHAQSRFRELATALAKPLDEVLAEAGAAKKAAEKALEELETTQSALTDVAGNELLQAETCVKDLEDRLGPTESACEVAEKVRNDAKERLTQVQVKLDSLLQSSFTMDTTLANAAVAKCRAQLDADVATSVDLPTELSQTESLLDQLKADLQEIENAIHQARGALAHVGGAVLKEQLERDREEYERLKANATEKELEFKGTRRLRDLLKESAAKQTAHLGKSLATPVTDRFRSLTANRYTHVAFDRFLRVESVAASGAQCAVGDLSIGTRDQLATLIRLALASYLKTVIVLDDQLTQTDPDRLGWFRNLLYADVRDHGQQAIVITCRPQDYVVDKHEVPAALERWEADDGTLTMMDLQRIIRRS